MIVYAMLLKSYLYHSPKVGPAKSMLIGYAIIEYAILEVRLYIYLFNLSYMFLLYYIPVHITFLCQLVSPHVYI